MMRRIEARISSMEGSCAFSGTLGLAALIRTMLGV
jgi:hypothetical protein